MINRRANLLPFIAVVLLAATLFGLYWANSRFTNQYVQMQEFANAWAGAHHWLMNGGSPYDPQVADIARDAIGGKAQADSLEQLTFTYPLYAMLVFGLFGGMGFGPACAAWMTFIQICLILVVILSSRVSGLKLSPLAFGFVLLAVFVWYSGARTILMGQLAVFVVLVLLFSIYLIQQKQDNGAGFVLALAMVKPEIGLLPIIFIIIWSLSVRRGRVATGFFAALASLLAVSLVLSPTWILDWLRLLIDTNGQAGWYSSILSMMAYSFPGIRAPLTLLLHGLFLVFLFIEWSRALKKEAMLFLWTFCFTLVISNLLAFRGETSYAVMLVPPLFFVLRVWQERWGRQGDWFIWLLMAIVVVIPWAIIWTSLRSSAGIIGEPLSLFTWLPFLTLFALMWTRWWAARSTRLPFDLMRERLG